MLEILTIMSKLDRVSRVVDPSSFVGAPGIWGAVQANGSIANCDGTAVKTIHKLIIGSKSSNIYEGHDVEVGRIGTMESVGTRCKVDSEGYAGTIAQGNLLYVSYQTTGSTSIGNLSAIAAPVGGERGTREIVARCEEVGTGYIVFKTISPYTASL